MKILAIDPGNTESAWVLIDAETRAPLAFAKESNAELLDRIDWELGEHDVVIEMVASYGMTVGADVFETCVWIGRFIESVRRYRFDRREPALVKRHPVKLHHCHDSRAKDANITRALVDRFAYGQPNHGKGTKKAPGWFYGFHRDIWQSYALAVFAADKLQAGEPL